MNIYSALQTNTVSLLKLNFWLEVSATMQSSNLCENSMFCVQTTWNIQKRAVFLEVKCGRVRDVYTLEQIINGSWKEAGRKVLYLF